jgi:hypothetical protein
MNVESIELTLDQKRQIAETAERAGRPWPEVLSAALLSYRPPRVENGNGQRQRSFYDALNEAGMIGMVKDAPPDLSTNPKYMEGFGRD